MGVSLYFKCFISKVVMLLLMMGFWSLHQCHLSVSLYVGSPHSIAALSVGLHVDVGLSGDTE